MHLPCKYGFSAQLLEEPSVRMCVYIYLWLSLSLFIFLSLFMRAYTILIHSVNMFVCQTRFATDQNRMGFAQPQISRLVTFRVNGEVPCNNIHKSILTNQSVWPCVCNLFHIPSLGVYWLRWSRLSYECIFRQHTHTLTNTYTWLKEKSNSFSFTIIIYTIRWCL